MLKNKSLENINRVANEELFTDLTPKEASVMVGGSTITLNHLEYSSSATPPDVAGMRVLLDGTEEASCPVASGTTGAICWINKRKSFLGDLSIRVDEFVDSLNVWNPVISGMIVQARAGLPSSFSGTSGITSAQYTLRYELELV